MNSNQRRNGYKLAPKNIIFLLLSKTLSFNYYANTKRIKVEKLWGFLIYCGFEYVNKIWHLKGLNSGELWGSNWIILNSMIMYTRFRINLFCSFNVTIIILKNMFPSSWLTQGKMSSFYFCEISDIKVYFQQRL